MPQRAATIETKLEQQIWTERERVSESPLFSMAGFWRSKDVVLNYWPIIWNLLIRGTPP